MSLEKRKKMKTTVPSKAMGGGKPIRLAIVGFIQIMRI